MYKIEALILETFNESKLQLRPNARPGIWLMYLLPFSIIIYSLKHTREASHTYLLSAALSVGLIGTSLIFIIQCVRRKPLTIHRSLHLLPAALTSTVFRFFLHSGFLFSVICGLIASVLYWSILIKIIYIFPLSFTLGEASITAQALILFLFSTLINVFKANIQTPTKTLDIATLVIQGGLCSIGLISILMYKFNYLRKALWFYTVSFIILIVFIGILLHALLLQNPLLWILHYLFEDVSRAKMVIYSTTCCIAAVIAINRQIKGAQKATPAIRKVFHILLVAVFLPGVLYHCSFIYLASGVIFGIFASLEMLRILRIPPLGTSLQDGFAIYKDDKDTGLVALTPLYLLVGCALPIWIHPAPCDMLDSAGFNVLPLLSGVLSIGIGDTAAGIVGNKLGKHKWPGTEKTVEGTMSCICSQLLVVWFLIYLRYIDVHQYNLLKTISAIIIGSAVEAKTTQIDNIVLPLVLFIILC